MTPEQEHEYWEHLSDILVRYYNKKWRIQRRIRELQDALVWTSVDRVTEIHRLRKLFSLPYEPIFCDRRTRDELYEELTEARDPGSHYPRGKSRKIRPLEVLPPKVRAAVVQGG